MAHKSLEIRQDDKFYCKLLSKENSTANPSFRVYYGGSSGAVPFVWESQPGTPKHPSHGAVLPPLTPPPSYQFSPRRAGRPGATSRKPFSKCNRLNSILPGLTRRKTRAPSPPPPASFSSSSLSSSASSTFSPVAYSGQNRRGRFSSPRSSFSSAGDDDDESDDGSPKSTLCFGSGHGGFRGCYKMVVVKNALLWIVGHGSGQGTA